MVGTTDRAQHGVEFRVVDKDRMTEIIEAHLGAYRIRPGDGPSHLI